MRRHTRHRLSSVALQHEVMDRKDTVGLLAAGVLLILQAFTDLTPGGPWDSASFTRGVLGLVGMVLVYLAWFKHTFGIFGVAPTVNRWSTPETTWLRVVAFGLGCLVVTRAARLFDSGGVVPEPAGLLITLVGVMAIMNGLYVWAVTNGPLNDEEE
jgi:hypothetical protein